jgi:1,4-dihydroxy-2-naphthoate octaprenyltransferase
MVERSIEAALPPRAARTWVQAVRPVSFTASIVPVFLGTAVAAAQGLFNPGVLLLTLLGAVAIQGAANLFCDYANSRGGDEPPGFYGSSGGLVRGILQPSDVLLAGLALTVVAGAIGCYLIALRGTPMLVLGILAALGAYFYSGTPIAYKYRALGDVMIFVLHGPLMVLGAYYIQSASTELVPMLYALPVGCLATAVHHVNTIIRDGLVDGGHGEVTVTRPLGPCRGTLLLSGLLGAAYLLVIAGAATGGYVWGSALALLSAPLAWTLARQVATAHSAQDLAMLDVAAARMYLVFGLLLVVGVLLPAS